MKRGWSHLIMSPTCPAWCGCHGNGRFLATAHCTFSSYGHLEAERVNQICWNLVYNSKLGPQWQSRDQILKLLKLKMVDGRYVGKHSKWHNSLTNGQTGTHLGWSRPPYCGCHGNGHCLATAHWTLMGVWRPKAQTNFDEIWYATQVRTTVTVTWSNIKIFKI